MSTVDSEDAEVFERLRPLLFAIAYRMLGSVMDAEDIVQEAYLQWQRRGRMEIASPKAFLSTIVTRQSINQLHAARARRETYLGPWLPEPVLAEAQPGTADRLLLHESLSMGFMVLLEQLTPIERAVFLLHDVFVYDFHEIARIIGKEEANCRQIARRARQHLQAHRPRFDPDPRQHQRLTQQFIAACTRGDLDLLVGALADDVTFWGDGGGKAAFSAPRPIVGAQRVAAFILGVLQGAGRDPNAAGHRQRSTRLHLHDRAYARGRARARHCRRPHPGDSLCGEPRQVARARLDT